MLKKKNFIILIILICSFSMTSCINMVERVFFNKNGGGTYTMSIDMAKLGEMIASLGGDDGEMGEGLGEMDKDFRKTADRIEAVAGVSNARSNFDKEKFIVSISFDFEDIDALNGGMSAYYHDEEKNGPNIKQHTFFTRSKNTITRTNTNLIVDALTEAMSEDDDSGMTMDPSVILGDMYYQMDIAFENDIRTVSNSQYEQGNGLSWGEKTVRWRKYLFKESDADKDIEVSIKTKK